MKTAIFAVFVIASIAIGGYAAALTSWTHTISGKVPDLGVNFQVYIDPGMTQVWQSGGTMTLANPPPAQYSETYYLKNLSNSQLTITGTATNVTGITNIAWAPTNTITLAPGASGSLTLTLSNFNNGVAGDFSVQVGFS